MKATINESFPGASPERLFDHIATLDRYPPWMRLVHRVTPMPPDDLGPAWWVELRARIGPFTRSKQLRMVRSQFVANERVRFERIEQRRTRPRRMDPDGRRSPLPIPVPR